MLIQWSDENAAFLVPFPEWQGRVFNPITHGETYEEAARNGTEALVGLVASARQHDELLPEPRTTRSVALPA
jgi:predicted RNase H-like HicB family nuclease